jgi:hypothetical protein
MDGNNLKQELCVEKPQNDQYNFFIGDFNSRIIANPFSEDGLKECDATKISKDKNFFFDNFYVHLLEHRELETSLDEASEDHSTSDESSSPIENKEQFINEFQNHVEGTKKSILIIKGMAGSGKTTYLHYLKHKYTQKHSELIFDILDFTSTIERVKFLWSKDAINFENKADDPLWHVIALFTQHISNLIKPEGIDGIIRMQQHCSVILDSYNEWFGKNSNNTVPKEKVEMFFNILHDVVNGSNAERENKHNFGTKLTKYLIEEFSVTGVKYELLRCNSLSLVLNIVVCLNSMLSYGNNNRYICAVDNIEYLLKTEGDEDEHLYIFNEKDIRLLIEMIEKADNLFSTIRRRVIDDKSNKIHNNYTFILSTRPSSFTLLSNSHEPIGDYQVLEIERFLEYNEIIEKRINNKKIKNDKHDDFLCLKESNKYIEFFEIVFADKTRSKWCMYEVIKKLCNYNCRQMTRQLIDIIKIQKFEEIVFFVNEWKNALSPNPHEEDSDKYKEYKTHNQNKRQFLRKSFLHMILCHYKSNSYKKDFFAEIIPTTKNFIPKPIMNVTAPLLIDYSPYNSYTRKILNYIMNYPITNNRKNISLADLFIKVINKYDYDLLYPTWKSDYNEQIEKFCHIIYTLGDATFEIVKSGNMAFGRCIDLELNTFIYNNKNIRNILEQEVDKKIGLNPDAEISNHVAITPAGRFFNEILSDIEFVNARFLHAKNKNNVAIDNALFSLDSLSEIDTTLNKYKFEKMFWYLSEISIMTMKNILVDDYLSYRDLSSKQKPLANSVRYDFEDDGSYVNQINKIVQSHTGGYIVKFLHYLKFENDRDIESGSTQRYPESGKDMKGRDESRVLLNKINTKYLDFLNDVKYGNYGIYKSKEGLYYAENKKIIENAQMEQDSTKRRHLLELEKIGDIESSRYHQ